MDGIQLQKITATQAKELPEATLTYPFGPEWKVWKISGKMFMLHTVLHNEHIVTLKADPEEAQLLRQTHTDITAGYHMNKRHWITLHPEGSLTAKEATDLVIDSYLLVVAKLPRKNRPYLPDHLNILNG